MNPFAKQLVWGDGRTTAQRHNDGDDLRALLPDWPPDPPVELPPAPARVSIAEFEADMRSLAQVRLAEPKA